MTEKMRSDFKAFKTRYGGGFLNDAADDSDKLLHTVAWDAWQAATALERERCATVCESERVGKNDNEGDIAYNLAIDHVVAAIRQGGEE